jgi:hypothetical protein
MFSDFSFWIWGLIIAQLLSAFFHSLSFIAKPKPRNETEKQLIELTGNYKADMGGGIKRSFGQLFIGLSTCFTMVYTMGAAINWYFFKTAITPGTWEGLLLIELVAYGLLFLFMIKFTFWPPIIVTGLVFIFTAGAYIAVQNS